jgi:hypothetical protein
MQKELVITTNKKVYKRMYYIGLIWLSILLLLTLHLQHSPLPGYLYMVSFLFVTLCLTGTLIFLFYTSYRFNRKTPMAIINEEGIWIKQFGIIPWNNIHILEKPIIHGIQIEALGIQVRDTQLLSKQASIAGHLIILESKILKCPTIVIDTIELNFDEITNFTDQFLEK